MDYKNSSGFTLDRNTMAKYIDHTLLKPDATGRDIERLCSEAVRYGFASVCLNPVFVPLAADKLKGTNIQVCTVVGFPLGANTTGTKVNEARSAVLQGAGEIDMVIWIGGLKEKRYDLVSRDIDEVVRDVRKIRQDITVKVIIETCLLTDDEKVMACKIGEDAGADFIKTSTGFSIGGATLSDIVLIQNSVGPGMGIKAAGGIRTAAQAVKFIRAGAARIGTSSGVNILKELVK